MGVGSQTEGEAAIAQAVAIALAESAPGGVLLAVSGGPDSTALLHAAATAKGSFPVHAATVDHGLRPDAAEEARAVGRLAASLGIAHAILVWDTPQRQRIQSEARAARYRLLAAHAAALGARTVLTAHTQDDQAETVLMRLTAGSGPAGLAGMPRERPLGLGLRLLRPFLDLPKADLVAYCERHGLPFLRDPSNADARFARARWRSVMPALEAEGLSAARLVKFAERLRRDEAALAAAAAALLEASARPADDGCVALDGEKLLTAPPAIALRAIDAALGWTMPEEARAVPRRLERLERLVLDAMLPALARQEALRRTLRGVLVTVERSGLVRLAAAPPRRFFTKLGKTHGGSAAAPPADLLGKGEGGAYIAEECPAFELAGSSPVASQPGVGES